jgi:N-acetylneuraminate epimerase
MSLILIALSLTMLSPRDQQFVWTQLPSLPDTPGVASAFAGISDNHLLVAGGANFPDAPPWAGGTKVWHDTVFGLNLDNNKWSIVGKLPHPIAYGLSISHNDSVICIGGSDATQHYRDVFRMTLQQSALTFETLPPLPMPIANACGTMIDNTIFLAGGIENPDSTETLHVFLSLDLSQENSEWKAHTPWPGPPRMLSVAAGTDDAFYLFSGTDLKRGPDGKAQRTYLQDAFQYDVHSDSWTPLPQMPNAAVAAPSPAIVVNQMIMIPGGDDGKQLAVPPEKHAGFSRQLQIFDVKVKTWSSILGVETPRVTVPLVQHGDVWFLCSGEEKPGIRSPEVWRVELR